MLEVGVVAIGRNEGDRLVRLLREEPGVGTSDVDAVSRRSRPPPAPAAEARASVGEPIASGTCTPPRSPSEAGGGFDASVLAAEDEDICLRLRRKGWTIVRISAEMALHDAGMTRLGQWWRRAMRGGYAYAQGAQMHGGSRDRHFVREIRRTWFWGFFLPALALGAAWHSRGASLLLLVCYPLQFLRIYRSIRRRGVGGVPGAAYAASCIISKFAEAAGAWAVKMKELPGAPVQPIGH